MVVCVRQVRTCVARPEVFPDIVSLSCFLSPSLPTNSPSVSSVSCELYVCEIG